MNSLESSNQQPISISGEMTPPSLFEKLGLFHFLVIEKCVRYQSFNSNLIFTISCFPFSASTIWNIKGQIEPISILSYVSFLLRRRVSSLSNGLSVSNGSFRYTAMQRGSNNPIHSSMPWTYLHKCMWPRAVWGFICERKGLTRPHTICRKLEPFTDILLDFKVILHGTALLRNSQDCLVMSALGKKKMERMSTISISRYEDLRRRGLRL